MGDKLIIEFLRDWIEDESLRQKVLYQEKTEMENYGLDMLQRVRLRAFKQDDIVEKILTELGIDLQELEEAVYGKPGAYPAGAAAAYDEGMTHIRKVLPAVIPVGTSSDVVLMGHGFMSDTADVTVQFFTGPPAHLTTEPGIVKEIRSDIDVWQRVTVQVTLNDTGGWGVRAHNAGEANSSGDPLWSVPSGTIHVV